MTSGIAATAVMASSRATTAPKQGPEDASPLTRTTFIQRVNTLGGLAPSTGCSVAADVGKKAFVPYEADYFFFRRKR